MVSKRSFSVRGPVPLGVWGPRRGFPVVLTLKLTIPVFLSASVCKSVLPVVVWIEPIVKSVWFV